MIARWKTLQDNLRRRMVVEPLGELPRFVAGADAAFSEDKTRVLAAAVRDCGPPVGGIGSAGGGGGQEPIDRNV
jgi:hypothetical protein